MHTMKTLLSRWWVRLSDQRGESSAIGLMLLVPVLMLLGVGLTYDWSGKVRASEEAVAVAQQAARAGADAGAASSMTASSASSVNPARARQGAADFLARAGVEGSVSIVGDQVIVSTTVPYQAKFLPVGTLMGRGEASAELAANTPVG